MQQKFCKKQLTKDKKISYTKNIEKRKQKEEVLMKETNAKTVEVLERERERERESLNIKDIGFINHSIKLYIKYKELKIKLTNGIGTSDI